MTASLPARIFGVVLIAAAAFGLGVFVTERSADEPAPLMSDSDVRFAQTMMAHHQQAVTICDLLTPQAAPEIRTLATQIKQTQLAEVGTMVGWLQIAGEPLHPGHHDMDHHAGGTMGIASHHELSRLQRATGAESETLFLQLMIRHHQGGVEMAVRQSREGSNAAVRQTALSMANEQGQEIRLMQQLMIPRDAEPLPYP